MRPVQELLGLGEGEARLRHARGGVEGLVVGVIFSVVTVVVVYVSQLMMCRPRTLPWSHMRNAMRCRTL